MPVLSKLAKSASEESSDPSGLVSSTSITDGIISKLDNELELLQVETYEHEFKDEVIDKIREAIQLLKRDKTPVYMIYFHYYHSVLY